MTRVKELVVPFKSRRLLFVVSFFAATLFFVYPLWNTLFYFGEGSYKGIVISPLTFKIQNCIFTALFGYVWCLAVLKCIRRFTGPYFILEEKGVWASLGFRVSPEFVHYEEIYDMHLKWHYAAKAPAIKVFVRDRGHFWIESHHCPDEATFDRVYRLIRVRAKRALHRKKKKSGRAEMPTS